MSHFAMLVITDHKPTPSVIADALAPFHQFECTGIVDEYVQSIDELPEARERYKSATITMLKDPEGNLFNPYDDRFYRERTEEELKEVSGPFQRTLIRFLPEGFEEVEVKRSEIMTFKDFVEDYYELPILPEGDDPDIHGDHKYGWYRVNSDREVTELIDRTNPNCKWDWWKIGGRWSGFLTPKPGVVERGWSDPDRPEKGHPGVGGSQANPTGVDVIRKGDVDLEAMRERARAEASVLWRKVREAIDPHLEDFQPWPELVEKHGAGTARKVYHSQAANKALRAAGELDDHLFWCHPDEFLIDHDDYVEQAGNSATVLFGVLKSGQWIERGKMGWWGVTHDEKDRDQWNRDFNKMLDELPDDCWLTVVDCHI